MKKIQRKAAAFLMTICIGIMLSGCAAKTAAYESAANKTNADETGANNSDASKGAYTDYTETQETALDSQSLYEQFLTDSIPAAFHSDKTENNYMGAILAEGGSYTLTELGECVSQYYERWEKQSYDAIQYAYMECPDSADANTKNLLIKFTGLNIYAPNDDSYAVFVITAAHGQLYVTDTYECWARRETIAYTNGVLNTWGSDGAAHQIHELSVILSNGKQEPIYSAGIHFQESGLIISIYTIGNEKYYLYDMSDCPAEEKAQCEDYINNYWTKTEMGWSTEEELQTAIRNQCGTIGVNDSVTQLQDEVAWNTL